MLSEVLPASAFYGSGPATLGRSHHLSCFHFPICQVNTGIPVCSGMWKPQADALLLFCPRSGQASGREVHGSEGPRPQLHLCLAAVAPQLI